MVACGQANSNDTGISRSPDANAGTAGAGATSGSAPHAAAGQAQAGGSAGGSGPASGGTAATEDCEETAIAPRLVRLTLDQLAASVEALLGSDARTAAVQEVPVPSLAERAFPPLTAPHEGTAFTDTSFASTDRFARAVADYVLENVAEVTGCGASPTEECALAFLESFAERAYRRPTVPAERGELAQVLEESLGHEATVAEATANVVYSIFSSPSFLYRTEFGEAATAPARRLSGLERASQLSYFITNAPPDDELLDVAATGGLGVEAELDAQIARLLETPAGKNNFETALASAFGAQRLKDIVLDPSLFPEFNVDLQRAMLLEAESFIRSHLWGEAAEGLLTARESRVNAALASLYGIPFPPSGADVDAEGFADVQFPPERAGILGVAGLLTSKSRPDGVSIIVRGLWVNRLVCNIVSAPDPEFDESIDPDLQNGTPREQANERMAAPRCTKCHSVIDPYGLALEAFDAIGRYDANVDASATLFSPPVEVASAAEMSEAIADSGLFGDCLTRWFLSFALSEGVSPVANTCAARAINTARRADGDRSFAGIVRRIARSEQIVERTDSP